MADNTKIEWADATLNYVNGCARVSPGCVNCYAERLAATRLRGVPSRAGLAEMTTNGPRWTGKINIDDRMLDQALRWRRPRRIFWNAHGDLFHESVPDEAIDRLFAVCALTPHHTHMILTKRAGRMREYFADENTVERVDIACWRMAGPGPALERFWPLPNVWLGVSVEDQQRADERIPDLLATPAAVRFISAEPLLGPVDLIELPWEKSCDCDGHNPTFDALQGTIYCEGCCEGPERVSSQIDWVIAGGESGPGARPMHPDWARSLRDQCAVAGVPFLFKQWGEWAPMDAWEPWDRRPQVALRLDGSHMPNDDWHSDGYRLKLVGKKAAGRLLDGVEHNGFPGGEA